MDTTDAEKMVEIVAEIQRAAGMTPDLTILRTIFCLITQPIKTEAYRDQMAEVLARFKDLATDKLKQEQFRLAVQASAPRLKTVRAAVKIGVSKIVRDEKPLS